MATQGNIEFMKCPFCNGYMRFDYINEAMVICEGCDFYISKDIHPDFSTAMIIAIKQHEQFLTEKRFQQNILQGEIAEPEGYYWKDYYKGNNF
jgi:hypothetical protein